MYLAPLCSFQNLRIEAVFPPQYFKVKESSKNGTYHIVETLERGFPNIDGELRAVLRTVSCP